MRKFILFLFCFAIVIQGVNALSLEPETYLVYTGSNMQIDVSSMNKVIIDAYFYLDAGESVNLTIYYGAYTLHGYINYTRPNPWTSEITLKLGDKQVTLSEYDVLGWEKKILLTYSLNESSKEISLIYDDGSIFRKGISYPVEDIEVNPIWRLDVNANFNANSNIKVKIGIASYDSYQEGWDITEEISENGWTDVYSIPYVGDVLSIIQSTYTLITGTFWYFKLIFVDNWLLTFALFESILLAYTVCTSRDIFHFYRRWIDAHIKLFEFIVGFIRLLINIFTSIVQALKPF